MIELFEVFALTLDEHPVWSHLLLDWMFMLSIVQPEFRHDQIKWLLGSGNVTDVQSDSYLFISTQMLRWLFVTLNSSDFVASALRHLVNQIVPNWMHRGRVWETTSSLNLSMFLGHSMPKSMNAFCIYDHILVHSRIYYYCFSSAASDCAAKSPIKTSQLTAMTGHVARHAWHGGHCDAYLLSVDIPWR